MKTLVLDIGGSNVKIWRTGHSEKIKFASGPELTPQEFVSQVKKHLGDWAFDRVSIGYPGEVLNGHPVAEPYNLENGWVGFDYAKAFGAPVKIMNDVCMQALGSYEGGRMLYLGLGTSMGSVFMVDGKIIPLALGHLMFTRSATFEQRLSRKGLDRDGVKRWRQAVGVAANVLKAAFLADYVVLGGGNAKKLKKLPDTCRRGANEMAYVGGVRMWEADERAPGLAVYSEKTQSA
jgi:polyphosphate glucokinase